MCRTPVAAVRWERQARNTISAELQQLREPDNR
jgi:hypothetical protein